ncbi:methyltransferase domain-containing protein [Micromonospora sp. NBRC 110038]|uniref:class I SAM-dependent methyltransferase n=1 Tax=Micromonospora sp. NBRC 110038 TaxID=1550034 RepID=UPI0035ABD747
MAMGGDSALSGEIEWARGIAPPSLAKMDDADGRALVEHGYDALSYHYRADDAGDGQYAPWLAALHRRLPGSATVLDLGCGCGVPAARFLAAAGHHVAGVDISAVQVERARRLVPTGTFLRADATRVDLPPGSPSSTCPCPSSPASSGASSPGCARAAGCWPPSATARGRAPRRTGSAVPPPCGGARPTRRPTAPGCGRPGCWSPPRSSCPRGRAGTPSSGPAGPQPDQVAGRGAGRGAAMSGRWRYPGRRIPPCRRHGGPSPAQRGPSPGPRPRRGRGRSGFGTKVPFDISSSVVCCFPMRGARGLEHAFNEFP